MRVSSCAIASIVCYVYTCVFIGVVCDNVGYMVRVACDQVYRVGDYIRRCPNFFRPLVRIVYLSVTCLHLSNTALMRKAALTLKPEPLVFVFNQPPNTFNLKEFVYSCKYVIA